MKQFNTQEKYIYKTMYIERTQHKQTWACCLVDKTKC